MASYHFILKFKIPKKKRKPETVGRVHLLYTHRSISREFSTGQTAMQKHWDDEAGKYYQRDDAGQLNTILNNFEKKIVKIVTALQSDDIDPDPITVRAKYKEVKKASQPEQLLTKSISFLWKEYIIHLKTTPSKSGDPRADRTISSNENSRECFDSFLGENKISVIRPENFTIAHFYKFLAYLQDAYPASNSRNKRLKHFKACMRHLKKLGYKVGFDVDEVKPKEKAGLKVYIKPTELPIIENANLVGRKDLIRDLVLINCNLGLRISDFKRLNENIDGDDVVLQTQKTGETVKIPITPKVKVLLKKYNYKLPYIPEPVFRKEVKELYLDLFPKTFIQVKVNGEFVTVHKSEYITLHSMIKTFVNLCDAKGMTVPKIAKIVGKSIPVLLRHYLDVNQEDASSDMREKFKDEQPALKIAQ